MEEEEEEEDLRSCDYELADEELHVMEWEVGLPSDDLMPLSQLLIPPELASAFSIFPEPSRTAVDVARACNSTISCLRNPQVHSATSNGFNSPPLFEDRSNSAADSMTGRKAGGSDEADDDPSARPLKRPRLAWTPQLHKRFVDVVAHVGIKNAVPKTIMQLMNVEGLTRENVASHLQKYRLYLKRMQGLSNDGPSSSDQLFASAPVPIPAPYTQPYLPMPVHGVPHQRHWNGHMGLMPTNTLSPAASPYHGFESHPYNRLSKQQRDVSGNKLQSRGSCTYPTPCDG